MTIEATLERIATALEALAKGGAPLATSAPAPVAAAKPRARATPVTEPPASTSEPEVDPFAAAEEPAKTYTRDDVRKALLACQERLGPTAAQAVFKKAAGVDTLPALKDDSKFAAIIAAANAA